MNQKKLQMRMCATSHLQLWFVQPPERQIVAILPQDFTVDGFEGIKDPRGMLGVRMEMFGVVYTGPKQSSITSVNVLKKLA